MYVYSVSHPFMERPLVFESSFARSDNMVKFTAISYLEANFPRLADWVVESDRFVIEETIEA